MKKLLLICAFSIAACEITVPVTGRIGETPARGQSTASTAGGSFKVSTLEGLICNGTYDAMSTAPTIPALVNCSDGRTGNLLITRTLDGLSGSAIGRLSDGTTGQFVFGDLTFDQAFGDGTGVRIR